MAKEYVLLPRFFNWLPVRGTTPAPLAVLLNALRLTTMTRASVFPTVDVCSISGGLIVVEVNVGDLRGVLDDVSEHGRDGDISVVGCFGTFWNVVSGDWLPSCVLWTETFRQQQNKPLAMTVQLDWSRQRSALTR